MPVKEQSKDVYQGRVDLRMAFEHTREGKGTLRAAMTPSHLFGSGDGPNNIGALHVSVRVLKPGEVEMLNLEQMEAQPEKDIHGHPVAMKDVNVFGIQCAGDPLKAPATILVVVGADTYTVQSGGWRAAFIAQGENPLMRITNIGDVDAEFSILLAGH